MTNQKRIIGDMPLPELLDLAVPGGLRERGIVHIFLEDKTLRGLTDEMRQVVLDLCLGHHELMEGEKRYQPRDCPRMRKSASCLHGQIWYSGVGVVHQGAIVAEALGVNPQGTKMIADGAETLDTWDMKANMIYGEVRAGRVPLQVFQPKVEDVQRRMGGMVLTERDRIVAALEPVIPMELDAWLAGRS